MQPREDHLGAGRADVDTDAGQRDVVVGPEGVLFQRPGRSVVVVIVVRIIVVSMLVVAAVEMVLQRVLLPAQPLAALVRAGR
jgi:hypothetical protein